MEGALCEVGGLSLDSGEHPQAPPSPALAGVGWREWGVGGWGLPASPAVCLALPASGWAVQTHHFEHHFPAGFCIKADGPIFFFN